MDVRMAIPVGTYISQVEIPAYKKYYKLLVNRETSKIICL